MLRGRRNREGRGSVKHPRGSEATAGDVGSRSEMAKRQRARRKRSEHCPSPARDAKAPTRSGSEPAPWGRGSVREGFTERQSSRDHAPRLGNLQSGQRHGKPRRSAPAPGKKKSLQKTRRYPASLDPRPPLHREKVLLRRFKCAAGRAPPARRVPCNFTNQTRRSSSPPPASEQLLVTACLHPPC